MTVLFSLNLISELAPLHRVLIKAGMANTVLFKVVQYIGEGGGGGGGAG